MSLNCQELCIYFCVNNIFLFYYCYCVYILYIYTYCWYLHVYTFGCDPISHLGLLNTYYQILLQHLIYWLFISIDEGNVFLSLTSCCFMSLWVKVKCNVFYDSIDVLPKQGPVHGGTWVGTCPTKRGLTLPLSPGFWRSSP